MCVPHITTFCWCMDLEQGSKLVGFLHLLISISLTAVCSLFAVRTGELSGTAEDAGDQLYSRWHAASVLVAVLSVVHVLLAVSLLVSLYNRWAGGVRAWAWVMLCLAAAALVTAAAGALFTGFSDSGSDIFLSFLEGLLFYGILLYCILCVHSYYLMLRSVQDMEGPPKSDF